jgi:phage baseplate assembly protein W
MAIRTLDAFKRTVTGNGLVHPLRRLGSNDFLSACGESLVKASISQICGTRRGELPWRPDFGLDVERYRHRNMSVAQQQRLSNDVAQTISRFESRALIRQCATMKRYDDPAMYTRVTWTLRSERGAPGVLLPPITQEVTI